MPREQRSDFRRRETSLYGPVKRYLETLGFTVKGEVCGCDLVALRGDEPPMVVIGELKLSFSLDLVLQAVDRTAACDEVWLAVGGAVRGRIRDPRVRKLCCLLGFGLLGVSPTGAVEILIEPRPWRPRRDNKRRARLVNEQWAADRRPGSGWNDQTADYDGLSPTGSCLRRVSCRGAAPHRGPSPNCAKRCQHSPA